jgi:two-component sensor histidine kinase
MQDGKDHGREEIAAGLAREAADAPDPVLREIGHRVKNNLQLIASLILLQSRRSEDPAAQRALKTVLERVNAVATVHRRLFQGDPLLFDVADFVRDLAGDLAAAARRDDIAISLTLDRAQIPAASAATFALVVNELLGNALRHAFADGRPGRIAVSVTDRGDGCALIITDDGVGMGAAPPGFGLTIVKLLCQQLHADLELAPGAEGAGLRASVRLPPNPPGEA